jgi:hypothetical protein
MRRHYTNYFRGLPNIKTFRSELVSTMNPEYLYAVLDKIITEYDGFDFAESVYEQSDEAVFNSCD